MNEWMYSFTGGLPRFPLTPQPPLPDERESSLI